MFDYYSYFMLVIAVLCGMLIGYQRQKAGHTEAGKRTLGLISLGSCLFTMMPAMANPPGDVWRMAANVITGIGFLGGGVLIKEGGSIRGVTTAAAIWVSAAIGIAFGCREVILGLLVTLISYVILVTKSAQK